MRIFVSFLLYTSSLLAQELQLPKESVSLPPGTLLVAPQKALAPIVDYQIDVTLDHENHMLNATQTLVYTNHSPDVIPDLRFHLYPNAFKNQHSAHYQTKRKTGAFSYGSFSPSSWAYLHIKELSVNGEDRLSESHYYRELPEFPRDETVLSVPLKAPLFPGQSVSISFVFDVKIPAMMIANRSGYLDDYYFIAQWFPKIGVWETVGFRGRKEAGWNCHPYHPQAEFYANFGNYLVTIRVPKDWPVGATGKQVDAVIEGELMAYTFQQDRVHDFAFTTSPQFEKHEQVFYPEDWVTDEDREYVSELLDIQVDDLQLKPVTMTLLLLKEHRHWRDVYLESLAISLKHMGLTLAPYPYETITTVDSNPKMFNIAGMEYPTFMSIGGSLRNVNLDIESTTVHEFVHQYFYGVIGSHEVEEGWLDEGFTTYLTAEIMNAYWKKKPKYVPISFYLPSKRIGTNMFPRYPYRSGLNLPLKWVTGLENSSFVEARQQVGWYQVPDPILTSSWELQNGFSYYMNAYSRPASVLKQLELHLGKKVMARILRKWYETWAFKHPTSSDFVACVNEVSGQDMTWFFQELLLKTGSIDFEVRASSDFVDLEIGYHDSPTGPVLVSDGENKRYEHHIFVTQKEQLNYPVEVRATFADGKELEYLWDGQGRWVHYAPDYQDVLVKVEVDPEGKVIMEKKRTNNFWHAEEDPRTAKRWYGHFFLRVQHLIQTFAGGF